MSHPLSRLDDDGYSVALSPLSPATFQRDARAGARRAGLAQRRHQPARRAGLPVLRPSRHGQDHIGAHPRQGAQLRAPVDGEPCCECESCIAVERGTSYDVHELDAASNNGVDAMRDLIEKASLGTPGRHKVYILDEVHMLSKAAEAALLKTLEEPPPHVVFVLATTDPQKVSDTIRSRTQHLQFHLLPMDVLEEHIRWLADDAGIEVTDAAVQAVLAPRWRLGSRHHLGARAGCRQRWRRTGGDAARRVRRGVHRARSRSGPRRRRPRRAAGPRPSHADGGHHPPPARLLPVVDGARARAAPRRTRSRGRRRSPHVWVPRRSCGRWSDWARCWSRCATPPIRGCCSKWRWCN